MKEIEVTCKLGKELSADEIQTAAVKALGVSPKMKQQLKYRIMRRSIDARNDILYRYKVEVYNIGICALYLFNNLFYFLTILNTIIINKSKFWSMSNINFFSKLCSNKWSSML